jgi:cold shock CspA family protein/ribosome-associated translation inhibitor RaiA
MRIAPEIAFRRVEPDPVIEKMILEGVDALERAFDRIMSCRIMVELPDRRHETGNLYHVRIDITVPGAEIVVDRAPPEHAADEDLARAVDDAFDRARRRLNDFAAQRRGDVKTHEEPAHGVVARLFPEYGFIDADDGLEVYFHRNSLVDGRYDDLEEGVELNFLVEQGDEGPQATSVKVLA